MNKTTASGGGVRYGFIDLLRGLAIVVMVETHVVNAYLPPSARKSEVFFWLSFVNGLVAPSFLFASGFSLVLQARRQWDAWLHLGPVFWKQMRRLGFILLIAYYLHLPHFGLSKFLKPQDLAFWKAAFQVDVLQCIVVSLVMIDLLILVMRKQRPFFWAAVTLGVAAALATPWIWSQDFTGRIPLSLALFLNPHGVSLFPVFPWISFVVAGSCAAHLFLNAVEKRTDMRSMYTVVVISLAAIVVSVIARDLPLFSAWKAGFYRTSPLYVVIRLGCVLILCAGLYFMERRLGWALNAIRLAGQESLLVYCAHLLLIFSILRQPPVSDIFGREAGYGLCSMLSVALILLTLFAARIWHGWKRNYPRLAKSVLMAVVVISAVIFLLR
jgi:uncharacterized membrane protein